MRIAVALALATLIVAPALAAMPSQTTRPPASPRHAAHSVIHGVRVNDPYRWLEDGNSPAVMQWIEAQNRYAEQKLAAMPAGKSLAQRVQQLAITSTTRSAPLLAGHTLFYLRETPPAAQPVLVAQAWPHGKPHVVVDLNGKAHVAMTGYWPSPDGEYVAYGTARGGTELTTIHVLDVQTGKTLRDALPYAGGGTSPQDVAWDADGKGFVYVRFPAPVAGHDVVQFHAALVHHTLGQNATADRVIFGRHYSAIAEYRLLTSPGAKHLAVLAKTGDGGPWEVYVRRDGTFARLVDKRANVRNATWDGDRLLVESFAGVPRGKVLAVDPATGKISQLLGERKGALQWLAPIGNGFLAVRSWGPDWWVDQYTHDGKFVRRLPLPASGVSIRGIASEAGQPTALITYGGWTLPARWAEYDAANGTLKTVFEVKPAADYSKVVATRINGTSKDGTRVPVTVLHLEGITAEIRPNDKISVVGAAGPMGAMHVVRDLCQGVSGITVYAGVRHTDHRLAALKKLAEPLAQKNSLTFKIYNPSENAPEKFDYIVLMAPVPELVTQAVKDSAPRSLINIFAGIPADKFAPIDLNAYIEKQNYFIGTSGSTLDDMKTVLKKVASRRLDTNLSVAAIAGLDGAVDGIRAVEKNSVPGKIIVYPFAKGLKLTPLAEMSNGLSNVAKLLGDGYWNKNAEEALKKEFGSR